MASFIQRFYAHVYINIILEHKYCEVYVYIEKKGVVKEQALERFETQNFEVPKEAIAYIELQERKSPFSYISILNTQLDQGAKKGCSKEHTHDQVLLCTGSKEHPWSVYAKADTLLSLQKRFKGSGVDYIFSPFLFISWFFLQTANNKAQMFIFSLETTMSVAVFQNNQLIFAKQLSIETDDAFETENLEEELSIDALDDVSMDNDDVMLDLDMEIGVHASDGEHLDDLDVLDDLSVDGGDDLDDLDDLDNVDELESFDEHSLDDDEGSLLDESKTSLTGFTKNFKRFEQISRVIHDFYANDDIETSFIENIYIASKLDNHNDLKGYLEDELFVDVVLEVININDQFINLVRKEVQGVS